MDVSPGGKYAVCLIQSEQPQLFDLEAGRVVPLPRTRGAAVGSAAFSPDGKTLALGRGRDVALLEVGTWKARATLRGHTAPVRALSFSADGRLLASGSNDKTCCVHDAAAAQTRVVLKGHTAEVVGVALSGDGRTLASAGRDKIVNIWNIPKLP
jgi:WD40 repeat protein